MRATDLHAEVFNLCPKSLWCFTKEVERFDAGVADLCQSGQNGIKILFTLCAKAIKLDGDRNHVFFS